MSRSIEENIVILIKKLNEEKVQYLGEKRGGRLESVLSTFRVKPLTQNQKDRVKFLQKQAKTFKENTDLSDEEISRIFSHAIDQSDFFKATQLEITGKLPVNIIQALAQKSSDLPAIQYTPKIALRDLDSVNTEVQAQIQKRAFMQKEVSQKNIEAPMPASPHPDINPAIDNLNHSIKNALLAYKEEVNADNKANDVTIDTPRSGSLWSSDQREKFRIADSVIHTILNEPLTTENAPEYLKFIQDAIKMNAKATGHRLFHKKNRLETILKTAEKEIITLVPHAKTLNRLDAYIEKAKKEDVEKRAQFRGPFESDRKSKLDLAETFREKIRMGKIAEPEKTEKEVIEHFRELNKEFTKGKYGGLHRAGELDKILKDCLEELDSKAQIKPKHQ